MRVIVFLFFMGRVHMLMGTMFPGVVVIMHMGIPGMLVGVRMLVHVLMSMGMRVLMGMHRISMPVLMGVFMIVFVGMQVLVFVLAFHDEPSRNFLRSNLRVNYRAAQGTPFLMHNTDSQPPPPLFLIVLATIFISPVINLKLPSPP